MWNIFWGFTIKQLTSFFSFRMLNNRLILRPVLALVKQPIIFRDCHRFQPIRGQHTPSISKIVSSSTSDLPRPVSVKGWVRSLRKQKQNTFLDIGDGNSGAHLQAVADTSIIPENVNFHSCVSITGSLVQSSHPKQEVELVVSEIELVNHCSEDYPFQPRHFTKSNFVRSQPSCKTKTNSVSSMMRMRNTASQAVHDYFQSEDYLQIHTPVLTSNDCEGGGDVFTVTPPLTQAEEGPYWSTPVHLTVSGQLHLEAMCNGISRVYTFNPAFRAERGRTRRHLSEFWMVEAETAFVDNIETIIDTMDQLLKHTANRLLSDRVSDMELYAKATKGKSNVENLEKFVDSKVVILTYNEAVELLTRDSGLGPLINGDLGRDHEQWLCQYSGGQPVAVINWPAHIKPFYMRRVQAETCYFNIETKYPRTRCHVHVQIDTNLHNPKFCYLFNFNKFYLLFANNFDRTRLTHRSPLN